MASLPPYSTFRTDPKQMMFPQAISHGNICTFTPPGFKQSLNVKFPDSRLAVCDKCKKNFKTRDMCRVRNTHTDPPWTTAYVCITVDSSCTDNDGKYIDRPLTVRMVQWQPYAVRKPFDSKTPVCAACKRTNRTRSFCRERHKHRQLPWCTVYVVLSALDQADPLTVVAGASKPTTEYSSAEEQPPSQNGEIGYAVAQNDSNSEDAAYSTKPSEAEPDSPTPASTETITSDAEDTGDDINDIAESRTFLIKVSSRGSSIHWLDLLEHDESGSGGGQSHQMVQPAAAAAVAFYNPADPTAYAAAISMVPHPQHAVDPNHAQYYAHYAQQHQNALKSQQQYFFQIQQRQQQQQMTHWQQQNAQYVQPVGGVQQQPGDVSATSGSGSTGGEATGPPPSQQQQQRDQGEDAATDPTAVPSPPPGQQWHMYYPPPVAYAQHTAATGEAIMNGGVGGAVFSNQQQHQHTNHHNDESQDHPQHDEQSEGAAEDEPDAKRARSDVV